MSSPEKATKHMLRKRRCAIYTRKSTEEGLEQAFNSLDAQREACAAFILSQKHEGWSVLATTYDDGGFSGGTIERPALQRLIADIEAGKIDVVVVYKVDRLTRALSDFAKLVEIFDGHGVSFVSITQQFNTTTSMGRLTLNVLLSFAQFEREVIAERVRDKIAASKKKGMWMGGMPPLGYDVKDRKLIVNKDEARTVIHIFRRYLELKSVRALEDELAAEGILSKRRTHADGSPYGGYKLSRGALYLMLQNRIYRGEITHKGNAYPGEHQAIVEQSLWDEVQETLAKNRVQRATGARSRHPSLLTGLVFDQNGERLTPTHAVKKGTRYRYYVSTSLVTGAQGSRDNGRRIPAGNLEGLVIERLRSFLTDQGELLDAVRTETVQGVSKLIERGRQIADSLQSAQTTTVKTMLMTLLARVEVGSSRIDIRVSQAGLADLLAGRTPDLAKAPRKESESTEGVLTLKAPARLKRVGREMRMLVEHAGDRTPADRGLLRIVSRAHDVHLRLMQNVDLTVHEVASEEHVSAAYIYSILRLSSLAPDIVSAIVNGRNPPQLTAKKLMRLSPHLPIDWTEQRKLLGFS
jgi:site-specific DNA recombinase